MSVFWASNFDISLKFLKHLCTPGVAYCFAIVLMPLKEKEFYISKNLSTLKRTILKEILSNKFENMDSLLLTQNDEIKRTFINWVVKLYV